MCSKALGPTSTPSHVLVTRITPTLDDLGPDRKEKGNRGEEEGKEEKKSEDRVKGRPTGVAEPVSV